MKRLIVRPEEAPIALDTLPSFDGSYRLIGEDRESCERIDRPGHLGYQDHDQTCPALERTP